MDGKVEQKASEPDGMSCIVNNNQNLTFTLDNVCCRSLAVTSTGPDDFMFCGFMSVSTGMLDRQWFWF